MYKICFYVPSSYLEIVKEALFEAGAGTIGNYDCCAWQTLGEGQFRPLEEASPVSGQINVISHVAEYKVEMICDDAYIRDAIAALRDAHPYEEPAIDVFKLEKF